MIEELEPFTLTQARKSTLLVAVVLGLIGGWQYYRDRPNAAMVLGAIAAILLMAAAIPATAMLFHKWWMTLAGILGYVNSRIILAIMFYVVITPIGALMRLVGHDAMGRRRKGREATYWRPRTLTRQTRDGYERGF